MKINHFSPCICMFCGYNVCYDELPVCESCAHRLYTMLRVRCKSCGRTAFECDCPKRDNFRYLFYFGNRDSKQIIYSIKDINEKREKAFFADMLIHSVGVKPERFDAIVYVPRTRFAINLYGFDQAKSLAKQISKKTGIPILPILKRKGSRRQKLLSYGERVKNIKDAYCLKYIPETKFKRILLVDDIVTTGATLKVCADILRKDVARTVVPCAIAKTNFPARKIFDF